MNPVKKKIADNLRQINDTIAEAAIRSGRRPEDVTLVVVTKSVEPDTIRLVLELGQKRLGENRVQELLRRAAMIEEFVARQQSISPARGQSLLQKPEWHMVGHLQRNKVRKLLPVVQLIHSVDSLRLAEEISLEASRNGQPADVLMQVNCSFEKQKFGVAVGAAIHLAEQISTLANVRLLGLMTMAPIVEKDEQTREVFVRLRELFEEMVGEKVVDRNIFKHLSMGMSQDYRVAVEEGATIVRIGSAVFQ